MWVGMSHPASLCPVMCSLTPTVPLTRGYWLNRAGWTVPIFVPTHGDIQYDSGSLANRSRSCGEGHKRPELLHELTWYESVLVGGIGVVYNVKP